MEALLTRSEVMSLVRVKDSKTLLRWIEAGDFPSGIGVGLRALWPPSVVAAWIEAQMSKASA